MIGVVPLVKQRQTLVKKPMIQYEFISFRDRKALDQMMRKLWLLGIHGNGTMRDILRNWWNSGDNVDKAFSKVFNLVVARADGLIVGAILHDIPYSTIDTYVTVGHRRLGVASGLVKTLRDNVGDRKVLCGWTGMRGSDWQAFYKKNFICWLDFKITKEDVMRYGGDRQVAWESMAKSAKLKTSAAYRKQRAGK